MKNIIILTLFSFICVSAIYGQGLVTIDPTIQRFIGDVSELNKDKHMGMHIYDGSSVMNQFRKDYNLNPNITGYRAFWTPVKNVKNDLVPALSSVKDKYNGTRQVKPYLVQTAHPHQIFTKRNTDYDYSDKNMLPYLKELATYTARMYRDEWDNAPEFYEPMNEPFVHSNEYYPEDWNSTKNVKVRTHMANCFSEMAKAVHAVPELEQMKVIGLSFAWPEFEGNDFRSWRESQKLFMDVAGDDVDGFSVHPYDNSQLGASNAPNSGGGRRSGANTEAILDMIENYSYYKWGKVKPIAITEYGQLVDGNGYIPVNNAQAVRSQIHMAIQFMERGEDISVCIPFNTKGSTTRAGLFVQENGTWKITDRKYFYEAWKDVKGQRVAISSNIIDVQTQAFVDGSELHVILNNLNNITQTVNLNMLNTTGLQNVEIKSIKVPLNDVVSMTKSTQSTAPSSLSLVYGETVILKYTYEAPITFSNALRSKKFYYKNAYSLKPITANKEISYTISDVEVGGSGKAVLRLGVGRPFKSTNPNVNRNLRPEITVNSTAINYPADVIRGYEQLTRKAFFGTLEIPVEYDLLKAGDNTVVIKFPDSGGSVSSAILDVQTYDYEVTYAQKPYPNGALHIIPGKIEAENFDMGGEGVAYHDTDTINEGGIYRTDEGVDIDSTEYHYISSIMQDEWLEYSVDASPGIYDIVFNVAADEAEKRIKVLFNNAVLDTITLTSNAGLSTFETDTLKNVLIKEGYNQVFKIEFLDGDINLDKFNFILVEAYEPVTGVTITPLSVNLEVEETEQLSANVSPTDAINKNVSWTSSNTNVASVDQNGLITAIAKGSATIIVTTEDGSFTAESKVTVNPIGSGLPSPWESIDIGDVASEGNAILTGGTFTISGSGSDIQNTADEFRYVYQSYSGDVEITAKVNSITNTNVWAKAGVMIRESLETGAKNVSTLITPINGVNLQYRTTEGGSTGYLKVAGHSAPIWVRVTKKGNKYSSYYSSNGTSWSQAGTTQTISMESDFYVGLAVTSHNDGTLCAAEFSDVSVVSLETSTSAGMESPSIAVYPNPATNTLNISGLAQGKCQITIYTFEGKTVESKTLHVESNWSAVNISGLAKGLHILKVQSENMSKTIRFVKE